MSRGYAHMQWLNLVFYIVLAKRKIETFFKLNQRIGFLSQKIFQFECAWLGGKCNKVFVEVGVVSAVCTKPSKFVTV